MKKRIFIIVFVFLSITILAAIFYPDSQDNSYVNIEPNYPSLSEVKELYEPYVGSISATDDLGYFCLTDFPEVVFYHARITDDDYYAITGCDKGKCKEYRDAYVVRSDKENINSIIVESYLYEPINRTLSAKLNDYLLDIDVHEGDYTSESIIDMNRYSILTYLDSYHGLLTLHILHESSDEEQIVAIYNDLDKCLDQIQSISKSLVIKVKIGLTERIDQYKAYKLESVFETEDIKQEMFWYGKTKR